MEHSREPKSAGQSGRPRLEEELQKRRNVSLSDRLADKAAQIGKGNISNGIRIAVEEYGN